MDGQPDLLRLPVAGLQHARAKAARTSAARRPRATRSAASDVGSTMRVVVTATNAGGSTPRELGRDGDRCASPPPAAASNTALPAISGTAVEGQTLTATHRHLDGQPDLLRLPVAGLQHLGRSVREHQRGDGVELQARRGRRRHTLRVVVTATQRGRLDAGELRRDGDRRRRRRRPDEHRAAGDQRDRGRRPDAEREQRAPGRAARPPTPTSGRTATPPAKPARTSAARRPRATRSAAGDVGSTVRVVVTATNAGGSTPASSAATAVVVAAAAAGRTPRCPSLSDGHSTARR